MCFNLSRHGRGDNIAQGNRTKSRRTKDVDVEPAADAGDSDSNQSASPGTGDYGESNSEIEFSEDDEGDDGGDDSTPGDRAAGGSWRKPVPSKLVIKAARARRARRNNVATGDIQSSAVK